MTEKEKLFDHFPPVSTKEWMDKINIDLKGADFNKKLVWKSEEGFEVMPFYRMADTGSLHYISSLPGEFPYRRGIKVKSNKWLIRQNIGVSDYAEANRKALDILMKGVDSLGFIITDPESVSEANFNILLKDIHTEAIELNFLCTGKAREITGLLSKMVQTSGANPLEIRGAFEADPLSRLMLNGTLCIPPEQGFDYLASVVDSTAGLPQFRVVQINASNFRNAGAGIVLELAFALSIGREYLTQLTDRGISADIAGSKIRFSFGTGSEYFSEIAKLRAARLLWSVITDAFHPAGDKKLKMEIHCVTAEWNKTVYDPYVNLLRTQTEAMSAILGGTDSLTVEPFDIVFRNPNEFSERIARNQQLILKEEAYFDKVADPAAGSYYIENLTDLITENAWKIFLEIEDKGGFLSCLKSGILQNKLSESAGERMNNVTLRKTLLLGTNHFPNNLEKISATADLDKVFGRKTYEPDLDVEPIKMVRGSQSFEKLRIATDNAVKRPGVFLFSIGNPAMRKARAQFSASFFGCAGYKIVDNQGFDSVDDGVQDALKSNCEFVVICSSDDEYLKFAPEIFMRLRDKAQVIIAGNPACTDELKARGIENFIHIRSDVIETLTEFNKRLGIVY